MVTIRSYGTAVAIAGRLDDYSRHLVGLRVDVGDADGTLAWAVIMAGADGSGIQLMSLSTTESSTPSDSTLMNRRSRPTYEP